MKRYKYFCLIYDTIFQTFHIQNLYFAQCLSVNKNPAAIIIIISLHTFDGLASSAKNVDWNISSASFFISSVFAWQDTAMGRNLRQCLKQVKTNHNNNDDDDDNDVPGRTKCQKNYSKTNS